MPAKNPPVIIPLLPEGTFHQEGTPPVGGPPPTLADLQRFAEELRNDSELRRAALHSIMRDIAMDFARVFAGRIRLNLREERARRRRAGYRYLLRRARKENGGFGG